MGYKPKTRVRVVADGVEKELFSIRERPGKGIVIKCYLAPGHNQGGRPDTDIEEQHFSVHPSFRSAHDATTITQKVRLTDGGTRETAALVIGSRESLLWLVFGGATSNIAYSQFDAPSASPRDSVISLVPYSTSRTMMCYVVLVAAAGFVFPPLDPKYFNLRQINFDAYSLGVYCIYTAFPISVEQGVIISVTTSPEKRNGVFVGPSVGDGVPSKRVDQIPALILSMFEQLTAEIIRQNEVNVPTEHRAKFRHFMSCLAPAPIEA